MVPDMKKFGMVLMTITRREVESFDHGNQLNFLYHAKDQALDANGKINFAVTGYDNDERELWEIQEVRDYFDFLDRCFPYWFFFLDRTLPRNLSPLNVLTTLLVPIDKVLESNPKNKTLELNIEAFGKYVDIHFRYLNQLTDELKMTLQENKRISKEVIKILR